MLKELYGHRIRLLHRGMEQTMNDMLAKMQLTAAQGHIMGFLSRQESPPCSRDVAQALKLSHPTVSGLLARMERKGFIELRQDTHDKRARRIYLLPKGEECIQCIFDTICQAEQRMTKGFTEEEQAQFMEYLNRATANMGVNACALHHLKEEE